MTNFDPAIYSFTGKTPFFAMLVKEDIALVTWQFARQIGGILLMFTANKNEFWGAS